ncbi:protein starmaker-like [Sabethes cyaneus]|uniref:protein starmaker-like n=1 Tax=Sabethes cyaneus TaxID=53552 RepID=UPI00237D8B65|nr:protein starmaker-like [Sabethes cyaneus]
MDWRAFLPLIVLATLTAAAEVNPCDPQCVTFEEINTLWAHEDPELYWQCDPLEEDLWIPVIRICAPETLFSFRQQTCVHPDDWEENCVTSDGGDEDPDDKDPDDEDPGGEDPDSEDPDSEDPDGEDPGGEDPDDEDPDGKDPDGEDPDGEGPDGEDPDDDDSGETDPDDNDPNDPENDVDPCIPRCATFQEINTLWAHEDPEHYWQCDPLEENVWIPVLRICAPETLFSFRQQTCVHPDDWEEVCPPSGGETTPDDDDNTDPGDQDPGDEDPDDEEPDETDPDDKDPDDGDETDPDDNDPGDEDPGDEESGETDPDDEDPDDKDPDGEDPDDTDPDDPDDEDPDETDPDDNDPNDPENDVDPCVPRCVTFQEINTLWAHEDPEHYWQCDPLEEHIWIPVLRICAPETLFSFRQQTCVHPDDWEEVCPPFGGETTPDNGDNTDPEDQDPGDEDPDDEEPDETDPDDKDPDDGDDTDPDDKDPGVENPDEEHPGETDPDDDKDPDDEDPDDSDPNDPDDKDPDDTNPEDKEPDDETPDDDDLCPEPSCVTFEEINTLWAVPDPNFFLQCRPTQNPPVWVLQQMPCAPGTWFSFRIQVCVFPEDWRPCVGQLSPAIPKDIRDYTTVDDGYFNPVACPCAVSESYCSCVDHQPPVPKDVVCGVPKCDSEQNKRVLWPGSTGDSFYQCVSDETQVPKTIGLHCSLGMLFDFRLQRCIHWAKGITTCSVRLAHDQF